MPDVHASFGHILLATTVLFSRNACKLYFLWKQVHVHRHHHIVQQIKNFLRLDGCNYQQSYGSYARLNLFLSYSLALVFLQHLQKHY